MFERPERERERDRENANKIFQIRNDVFYVFNGERICR